MQSSLNALEMPKHTSDTRAAIKGQIIWGTAGAIISYEKTKKQGKNIIKTLTNFINATMNMIITGAWL